MTSARRCLLAGGALAGLLTLAAAPAAFARPAPFTVSKGVRVKAAGVTSLAVSCPSGAVALAGAVVSASPAVTAGDSVPRDSSTWVFRFTSLSSASSPSARAAVRCLALKPAANVRHWKMSNFTGSRTVRLGALSTRRVRVRCTSGYIATGYGLSRSETDPGGPLPSADIRVAGAVPSGSSFLFRLENTGGDPLRVTARVRCLGRMASARRSGSTVTQKFAVEHVGFADRVRSGGRRVVRHGCPRDHFSLAAGLSLSARDDIFLTGAHPDGRRGASWSFNHPSGKAQRVRTYLTCLSLRTNFR